MLFSVLMSVTLANANPLCGVDGAKVELVSIMLALSEIPVQ